MCSLSSGNSLPPADRYVPPPHSPPPRSSFSVGWVVLGISNPQSRPLLLASAPIASSSPRGAPGGPSAGLGLHGETDSADLSSLLLGNGGLEHDLLEALDGLEGLDLGGGQKGLPPLLPQKRRGSESREGPSRSPPLSGFSSPASRSSPSLPFSSPVTPDPHPGAGGAPSPGSGRSCVGNQLFWFAVGHASAPCLRQIWAVKRTR